MHRGVKSPSFPHSPPLVPFATRPKAKAPKTFAQTAALPSGLSPSVDGIVRLAKAFPELPTERLVAMSKQAAPSKPKPKKPKMGRSTRGGSDDEVAEDDEDEDMKEGGDGEGEGEGEGEGDSDAN